MRSLGTIGDKDYEAAKNSDLKVIPLKIDASDAPYLVDYIRDELLHRFQRRRHHEQWSSRLHVTRSGPPEDRG